MDNCFFFVVVVVVVIFVFVFFFLLFVLFGTVCLRICRITLLSEVDQFIIYQSQKLPPNCKNVETL